MEKYLMTFFPLETPHEWNCAAPLHTRPVEATHLAMIACVVPMTDTHPGLVVKNAWYVCIACRSVLELCVGTGDTTQWDGNLIMAGKHDPYRYHYDCFFCGLTVYSRRTALAHRCNQNKIDRAVFVIREVK